MVDENSYPSFQMHFQTHPGERTTHYLCEASLQANCHAGLGRDEVGMQRDSVGDAAMVQFGREGTDNRFGQVATDCREYMDALPW